MEAEGRIPKVSQYGSVDPAPPAQEALVADLTARLCDEDEPMFQPVSYTHLRAHET